MRYNLMENERRIIDMKWPASIMLIRHVQSEYNALKERKNDDPLYQKFLRAYTAEPTGSLTVELAQEVSRRYALGKSDAGTPIAAGAERQAVETGKRLSGRYKVPHVIYVSPYDRTLITLDYLKKGWPELSSVRVYEDENLREREHGLSLLYNDWRVFFTLHPEQRALYEQEGPYRYTYPQGENIPMVRMRGKSWTHTVIREHAGERVLVVAHHEMILALRANWERWVEDTYLHMDEKEKPANCGVTLYTGCPARGKRGKLVLAFYNKVYY